MKRLTLNLSNSEIFAAIEKSAENLGMEIREKIAHTSLTLFSGGSLFSYGNIITVKIENVEPMKSFLLVSSESASSLQLIDWGTNENLEIDIINEVKKILG